MCKYFLLAFFSFISLFSFSQNKPKYNAEIVRDSFGVPHIFGKTDADCAYGLVWAECEDDFKTLQFVLHIARGMLGRNIGVDGAKVDYAVQLLRIQRTIEERYETDVSPEFKKVLEAGAAAGNLYAERHPEEVIVKQAFPVRPQDFLSGYMLAMALMTGVDGALNSIVSGTAPEVSFSEAGRGSNGIAMNSRKTADGNVYLDVNSHQPLEGPLSWYEAHVHSEEGWNMYGSTFHGGLTIFHGVNENLGWAHTINGFDAIDIFQLQPDPKKKGNYLVDGVSYPLEKDKAKLTVNLAKHPDKHKFILKLKKKIWWSKYGATVVNKKGIFAMRLASNMTIKAPEQWYRMNKAKNYTEFRKALEMQGVINQNVIYGDRYDTIFIISNGAMPVRADGYDWKGTVPGNTEKTLWKNFFPEDSLLQRINPNCGYVFNANQTSYEMTAPEENPKLGEVNLNIGYDTLENNRSRRFYENIAQYDKVSWDDFLKIKYDSRYPEKIAFLRNFDINDLYALKAENYPDVADAIHLMQQWNKDGAVTDTIAAFVYEVMYNMYDKSGGDNEAKFRDDVKAKTEMYIETIRKVKTWFLENHGKLNIPLGDYQRHVRGNVDLPIDGGPDMWNAKYGNPYGKGKRKIWLGESFILLARFTKDGPVIRTVSPYGTSNKEGAKHYTDQMQLYVNHQTKEESLSKEWAYQHAERIYKAGE